MSYTPTSNSSGPLTHLKYMCDHAGVQFKVAQSYGRDTVYFKNVGEKLVRVSGMKPTEFSFLEPGEELTLDLTFRLDGYLMVPEVVALNNGV